MSTLLFLSSPETYFVSVFWKSHSLVRVWGCCLLQWKTRLGWKSVVRQRHVLNSILQLDGFILCFCVRWELQPVNPATDVQIRGSARRLLSLAWCPKITFEHARPCLVEYLMRDEECLKNRGDVKVLGVPFLWHYLEWDLLRVGKTGAPQTSQEKGEITLIKEKNRILLQSYSSSARRAT